MRKKKMRIYIRKTITNNSNNTVYVLISWIAGSTSHTLSLLNQASHSSGITYMSQDL